MTVEISEQNYRLRLLEGLAQVLVNKSYRDITLAHITAAAKVSRRTFYEQFSTKDDCLLALAEHTSKAIMASILAAYRPAQSWHDMVNAVTLAYLGFIESKPQLMGALYIELAALGEAGVRMRRQIAEQFALFLQTQIKEKIAQGESLQPLSLPLSMALVAGINELILYALSDSAEQSLMALAPVAEQLIHRVVT